LGELGFCVGKKPDQFIIIPYRKIVITVFYAFVKRKLELFIIFTEANANPYTG
jgi:hypothetical protein